MTEKITTYLSAGYPLLWVQTHEESRAIKSLSEESEGYMIYSYDIIQGLKNHQGVGISIPGWKYPAVVTPDGSISVDVYNGRWGDLNDLNMLSATYGIEKAKIEALKQGYSCFESIDEQTGELELTIDVGEA